MEEIVTTIRFGMRPLSHAVPSINLQRQSVSIRQLRRPPAVLSRAGLALDKVTPIDGSFFSVVEARSV